LLKSQHTFLNKFFIVEIKVDLQHVYDDNDVDLIEKCQNDRAQEVENTSLVGNIELLQNIIRAVSNPKNEDHYGLCHVLHIGGSDIDQQFQFFVLLFNLLLLLIWTLLTL